MGIILMAGKKQTSTKDAGKNASKNAQSAKKAGAGKGGKAKKKSWTKTKVKEKLNNAVFLDDKQFERMLKEVPKILCVTRALLIEKFKIGGSIARALIKELSSFQLVPNTTPSLSTEEPKQRLLLRRQKQRLPRLKPPRPRRLRSECTINIASMHQIS